jgi:hypothetical protein
MGNDPNYPDDATSFFNPFKSFPKVYILGILEAGVFFEVFTHG